MGLGEFCEGDLQNEIKGYLSSLEESFSREIFEQMSGRRLQAFKETQQYQEWIQANDSQMFILSGNNEPSEWDASNCWVSPIALDLLQEPPKADNGGSIVSHFLLRRPVPRDLIYEIIPVILLRLLRKNPMATRKENKFSDMLSAIRTLKALERQEISDKTMADKREKALVVVARKVIELFDRNETIYVVVDRVDRCMIDPVDQRMAILRVLVSMVEAAQCQLKVLVINSANSWSVNGHDREFGQHKKNSVIMHTEQQGAVFQ